MAFECVFCLVVGIGGLNREGDAGRAKDLSSKCETFAGWTPEKRRGTLWASAGG